jgi:DNA-directed RNA polymerase subunit RPC12/RpoP
MNYKFFCAFCNKEISEKTEICPYCSEQLIVHLDTPLDSNEKKKLNEMDKEMEEEDRLRKEFEVKIAPLQKQIEEFEKKADNLLEEASRLYNDAIYRQREIVKILNEQFPRLKGLAPEIDPEFDLNCLENRIYELDEKMQRKQWEENSQAEKREKLLLKGEVYTSIRDNLGIYESDVFKLISFEGKKNLTKKYGNNESSWKRLVKDMIFQLSMEKRIKKIQEGKKYKLFTTEGNKND